MIDVQLKYPKLYKTFKYLFRDKAEEMLNSVCDNVKYGVVVDLEYISVAFYWDATPQGATFWGSQEKRLREENYYG